MATEDEELALLIEHREILNRFHDAKTAAQADPDDDAAQAAWVAAKHEMRAHREFWRGIREYVGIVDLDDGDAVASPDTHSMGFAPQEV